MGDKARKGAFDGILLALLIILAQPFFPSSGLIPEAVSFLTTVPLVLAAVIFSTQPSPLVEGGLVLFYFAVIGGLIGIAFERKRLWGWLFVIAVAIHHYIVYEQFHRQMGEVVQSFLVYLRLS